MPGWFHRAWQSDLAYEFRNSPVAIAAALIAFVCIFAAIFANVVAPHHPFDLATLELGDAFLQPSWVEGGKPTYFLGTDDQGRDILSALMYGARISLLVGLASVVLSVRPRCMPACRPERALRVFCASSAVSASVVSSASALTRQ